MKNRLLFARSSNSLNDIEGIIHELMSEIETLEDENVKMQEEINILNFTIEKMVERIDELEGS